MTRVEENEEIIEMIAQLADDSAKSKDTSKEGSYLIALASISSILLDISKSLAIIADSISERK